MVIWYKGRLVLSPHSLHKEAVIHEFHDTPIRGHSSMLQTYKRIASNFYWVGMKRDIQNYVRQCDVCQRSKSDTLTQIHPFFHVLQLKTKLGNFDHIATELPQVKDDGMLLEPKAILDFHWRKFGKKILQEALVQQRKIPLGNCYLIYNNNFLES